MMTDFTNNKICTSKSYDGSTQKRAIYVGNDVYMLKFADKFTVNPIAEDLSCKILRACDFDVQETILGYARTGSRERMAVACKDFTTSADKFITFKTIVHALAPNKMPCVPRLKEINLVYGATSPYFDNEALAVAKASYWDLFVLDAFLANSGRYCDNWGFLVNTETGKVRPSPIYSCGHTLFISLNEGTMLNVLNSPTEIERYTTQFPSTALDSSTGHRVQYKDYLLVDNIPEVMEAVYRVVPKININIALDVIAKADYLNEVHKEFFSKILSTRYYQLMLPAYERSVQYVQNKAVS